MVQCWRLCPEGLKCARQVLCHKPCPTLDGSFSPYLITCQFRPPRNHPGLRGDGLGLLDEPQRAQHVPDDQGIPAQGEVVTMMVNTQVSPPGHSEGTCVCWKCWQLTAWLACIHGL